jgi:hypothetical protein
MQLLDTASKLDISGWLRGLVGAGISGGASAIAGGLVVTGMDPEHYSFQAAKFWVLVGALFMANAIVSMAKFLQTTPLPVEKTVTVTKETVTEGKKPPVITTTVAETHKELLPPS